MKTVNYTPHTVNFFAEADVEFRSKDRKFFVKAGAQPFASIPPSGQLLNVRYGETKTEIVDGIPERRKPTVGIDAFPSGKDRVIVSALYASAAAAWFCDETVRRVRVVVDPVYAEGDKGITVVGCLGLAAVKE